MDPASEPTAFLGLEAQQAGAGYLTPAAVAGGGSVPPVNRQSLTTRGGEFAYTVKEFVPPRTVVLAEPLVSYRDESETRPPTDLLHQFVTVLGDAQHAAAGAFLPEVPVTKTEVSSFYPSVVI